MSLTGKPEDYIVPITEVKKTLLSYHKWAKSITKKGELIAKPYIIMNGECYEIDFDTKKTKEVK
jgi:hypothetical protein